VSLPAPGGRDEVRRGVGELQMIAPLIEHRIGQATGERAIRRS
jgi:hypothetical protein